VRAALVVLGTTIAVCCLIKLLAVLVWPVVPALIVLFVLVFVIKLVVD